MKNAKITKKEYALIKGALRRVFARSELRLAVIAENTIEHSDPNRPRVRKWVRCTSCKNPTPAYKADVDHIDPVIPVDRTLENLTVLELVNRIWCDKENLTTLCDTCHNLKCRLESAQRRAFKKERTQDESKTSEITKISNSKRSSRNAASTTSNGSIQRAVYQIAQRKRKKT